MIDFKKELKFSDLVRRTEKAGKPSKPSKPAATPTKSTRETAKKTKPRELVGIKIGASQLAAARVANNGSARLCQLARQPLPPGIVSDGEVRDVAALSAALNEFFTTNNLPRRGVRMGVASNHVGVRSFEIAGIDDESQLANAVLFRAHDAVSIPVDEAMIDYRVLSREVDESGTINRKILLVAAYREPIERYSAAFREAGIGLVGIDLEAFALLRALSTPLPDDVTPTSAVVVVNAGHERTTLAVSDGNVCEFTRVLEWGGLKLATAVARELPSTLPEAEEFMLNFSLESAAPSDPAADPRAARAREAVDRELRVLARELVASLEFYQGQPGSLPISEILLAGGASRHAGFAGELEKLTRVRVRVADPLVRVEVDETVEQRDDLASMAVAIGLGVDD